MEKIIYGIMLGVEGFYFIWSLATKDCHRKIKTITRGIAAVLLTILLCMGLLKGLFRYMPIIVIVVIQILLNPLFLLKGKDKKFSIGRGIVLFLGNIIVYSICLLPALIIPQTNPIKITGEHEVAIKEYTWEDKSRVETYADTGENRKLTVKFWYPKEAGSYPLVVFSHGSFGVIDSNNSTCKNLASNGYVVVSIGHTYQAMYAKDTSGKVITISKEFMDEVNYMNSCEYSAETEKIIYENSQKWIKIRTADENFVLDTILNNVVSINADVLWGKIDTQKIGLMGHSLGGGASVEVGRQRDDIDAVIDLEGTMFGEYAGFDESAGLEIYRDDPYPIPILDVNSRDIYERALDVPDDGYVNFYMGERAVNYQSVIFENVEHMNFTDLAVVSPFLSGLLGTGTVDARECIENVNDMVLEFFNCYLKNDKTAVVHNIYE